MTIETTDTRDSFPGNDSLTAFSYSFWCDTASAIKLVHITSAGVETVPVYDTDYTVTLDGDNIGGTITFPKAGSSYATLATGETLVCYRQMPITQAVNLRNAGTTFRSTLMGMVDRVVAALQDKDTDVNRTLRQPDSDTTDLVALPAAADRASSYPFFDANGQLTTVSGVADVNVSSAMEPVVTAATLAAARTAMGLEIGADVQAYDADTTKNDVANSFTATQKWAKGADVASANALSLGTDGNYFDITGTTAITSIGTLGVGTVVKLHFDAALTLTHHATDLILPGGANITTAAGDEAEFVEYASGDWRCRYYSRASGKPVVSNRPQYIFSAIAAATGTTDIPDDNTSPTSSEGTEVWSQAITLNDSANSVVIRAGFTGFMISGNRLVVTLFRDSTLLATWLGEAASGAPDTVSFEIEDSPGGTGPYTYSIRVGRGTAGGTWYVNQWSSAKYNGSLANSGASLTEIAA